MINSAYFVGHGVTGESFKFTCFFAIGEDGNCDIFLSSGELIFYIMNHTDRSNVVYLPFYVNIYLLMRTLIMAFVHLYVKCTY
jgi:hypothetical protein